MIMLVKITGVITTSPKIIVNFSCSSGEAFAIWEGKTPNHGQEYDVEIDIIGKMVIGENIKEEKSKKPSISVIDGDIQLTGKVVAFDCDGLLTISINGSLIMIEVGYSPELTCEFVRITPKSIRIFDTNA